MSQNSENHVALIRQPGMVVEYIRCGFGFIRRVHRGFSVPTPMLKRCSPIPNLKSITHGIQTPIASKTSSVMMARTRSVSVLSFIRRKFTDFQRSQEPPIPRDGVDARHLSRLLGRFLQLPGAAPPRPVSDPRPVLSQYPRTTSSERGQDVRHRGFFQSLFGPKLPSGRSTVLLLSRTRFLATHRSA